MNATPWLDVAWVSAGPVLAMALSIASMKARGAWVSWTPTLALLVELSRLPRVAGFLHLLAVAALTAFAVAAGTRETSRRGVRLAACLACGGFCLAVQVLALRA